MKVEKTVALTLSILSTVALAKEPVDYVNPLIGTASRRADTGNSAGMMPYVCPPFAAVEWVPMTRLSEVGILSFAAPDKKFLGPDATGEDARRASGELLVSERTPPTFLVHARTDEVCPVEHSRRFAAAMRAKGRPIEYLELESGRHGLGCGKGELWAAWLSAFGRWLQR